MTTINYSRPPITEAVIGIEFTAPVELDQLLTLRTKFKKEYPNFENIQTYEVDINLPNNRTNLVDNNQVKINANNGFRLSSPDVNKLLLFWPKTFTISQLAPYQGWDDFFNRFEDNWKTWKRALGFREISRIGLRFINRIDIPIENGIAAHEEYINIYPKVPVGDWPLHNFALQMTLPIKDTAILCQINSAIVESPLLNHLSIIFDLDLSLSDKTAQSDEDLLKVLINLRSHKNKIFESFITDKTRELFKND